MKKVLLWIGGIIAVIFLLFVVAVVLIVLNVVPVSRTSVGHDELGYDGISPPKEMANVRAPSAAPTASRWTETDESAAEQGLAGDRVVIRSARLAIVSKDVQQTAEALKEYAQQNDGLVMNAEVRSEEGEPPTATVAFRIPADKLDAAVAFVRSQAVRVASESVSGEDVTEEYVDVTARLKNLAASETQLLAIMKDARKTEDVLNVRRELERVRAEIESLTGRKKYLDQSAKMSSVFVSIATDEASLPVVEPSDQWRPFVVAKAAASALLDVLKFLVNVVIWVIVFVPIWGTAILIFRSWRKKRLSA